jgi:hypothetical protein
LLVALEISEKWALLADSVQSKAGSGRAEQARRAANAVRLIFDYALDWATESLLMRQN